MMANPYWHNNDPLDNRIRQTVKDWESSPPSEWDTPPADLWQKIAPVSAVPAKGFWSNWKWIAGALTLAGAAAIVAYLSQPAVPAPSSEQPAPPVAAGAPAPPTGRSPQTHTAEQGAPAMNALPSMHQQSEKGAVENYGKKRTGTSIDRQRPAISGVNPRQQTQPPGLSSIARAISPAVAEDAHNASVVWQEEHAHKGVSAVEIQETNSTQEGHNQFGNIPVDGEEARGGNDKPEVVQPALPLDPAPLTALDHAALMEDGPAVAPFPARRVRKGGHFFAGAMVSPNYTFRQIQSSRPIAQLPAFLRDNEFAAWTTEWGMRVGWRPNRRLAFSTGIGSYSMAQQSLHRFRIPYDPGRERPVGNNNFQGNYNLSVPSAYGDATVELGVQRPGNQNIPAGQFLAVEMRTDLHIKYITLPLNAYYFLSSGRFSAGLKGGVALNLLQEETLTARARITQRGLDPRTVTVQRGAERTKRVAMDYQLGMALWYRPTASWMVSVEPSFRHSFGPVIERELFNVSQYAIGIQAGVQKIF